MSRIYQVPPAPPANEGKTVAAWTTCAFFLAGAIVVAFGIAVHTTMLVVVGAAIVLVGLVVGFILAKAGLGKRRVASGGESRPR